MKIATDLGQSKKLAKILPADSADMFYGTIAPYDYSDRMYDGGIEEIPLPKIVNKSSVLGADEYDGQIPAWSLSALMSIIPFPTLIKDEEGWYGECEKGTIASWNIEPIDTCVEMILKLKEKGAI